MGVMIEMKFSKWEHKSHAHDELITQYFTDHNF